jgi:amino acid adenylation domain-containing protein
MKTFYPLTYAQKAIWNTEKYFPNTSINNISGTLRAKEEFDFNLIEKAINLFLKKNDALRIRISIQNGEPVQYIAGYEYYPLHFFDLSSETDSQKLFAFEELLTHIPLSVIDSQLFYIAYFKLPGEVALFFKYHHLIADAWSVLLIGDSILQYYLRLKNNEKISDQAAPSYIDYIATEKDYQSSEQFLKSKSFWETKTGSIPEFINLKNRPNQYSTKSKRISFLIPEEISLKINQYCKERNISIFALFTAILSIYIRRTTSKKDIILGTTVLNRLSHKEKNTIGMFVNTLPIRLSIEKAPDFNSYVSYVYLEWKKILRHQRYPYNLIIEDYRQKNQTTGDLFDVTITYQNAVLNLIKGFHRVKTRWHPNEHQTNSLHVHINNRENSNNYVVNLDYLVALFTATDIREIYHHLMNLLTDALDHSAKSIMLLELLSVKEKQKLLFEFNNTHTPVSVNPEILHGLFEKQVIENPDNIALIFENQTMTYRELNEKACQIARVLRNKGVTPDSVVALVVERSFEIFTGILGILQSGGAYLPIDPTCPRERGKYLLEDCNCRILLADFSICDPDEWDGEIINIHDIPTLEDGNVLENINHPNDLAYIIYTSGSTGKPKGVMIEHRSIVNTIKWRYRYYGFSPGDVLLQIPPYNFDSAVEDIFSFLSAGATIVIAEQVKRMDLIYLKQLITRHNITHFLVTPLFYNTMLDEISVDLKHLSSVTVAGENFQISLVKKHFEKLPQVKLYNEYGPTENSVCSTVYQFSSHDKEVLIGKPISNCHCYVLSSEFNIQPVGLSGELYLGGPGLARGYMNNSKLTNEKFLFVPGINERLYRTGDLVRWTPDGNLKFIERIDNQIKIRGFRVELDEIKNIILSFGMVKDAIVISEEGKDSNILICAYIIAGAPFDLMELKEYLGPRLPNYMIPSYFIFIDSVPLTHNGKIDKNRLPKIIEKEKEIISPENAIEKQLVEVWRKVFNVDIGITNDIFEFGANSISLIQILTLLHDFNWNLTIQSFYKYSTIKELANYISNSTDLLLNSGESINKTSF